MEQSPKTTHFLAINSDQAPVHLPPCRAFSSGAGNACPALRSWRSWKDQCRQLASVVATAAQSRALKAFTPTGKAQAELNYGLGMRVSPLGNSADSATEQQEKSDSSPQRFYHLSLGMGEASPPSCEQVSAFCWLFYVIRTNSLEMSHRVSRVSREMSSSLKGKSVTHLAERTPAHQQAHFPCRHQAREGAGGILPNRLLQSTHTCGISRPRTLLVFTFPL